LLGKLLHDCRLAVVLATSVGCGTVSVRSVPTEAEVSVFLPGKEAPKVLGKTPFDADLGDLEDYVNEGTIVLVVKKAGYLPSQFVVPNLAGGKLDIETSLQPNLPSNYTEVNRIVGLTLRAERHILSKQFDEALATSAEIKRLNENIAAAYEIDAAVHFLKADLEKSRAAWIRAIELDPNNPEAQNMLALVEKRLGIAPSPTPGASPGGDAKP
jgi:tetratricopeptide (TPR) repeat protein